MLPYQEAAWFEVLVHWTFNRLNLEWIELNWILLSSLTAKMLN